MKNMALSMILPAVLAVEAPKQLPTFSSGVEVVRLDVSITQDGVPVRGLTASNFRVFDDGVRQKVELVGQDDTAIHAVLALDTSLSVAGQKLADLKRAANLFVDALQPEDALSLMTFSECLDLSIAASQDRKAAHTAIELARTRKTTSLRDACLASLIAADPAQGRPLVLVFSDGRDVGSWKPRHIVIDQARQAEVVVHAVVPSAEVSSGFIEELTDQTGGRIWYAIGEEQLERAFLQALEEFRARYRLRYYPQEVKGGGWHKLKVTLRNANGKVRARPGYLRRTLDELSNISTVAR
jgi:VWFA-related protein